MANPNYVIGCYNLWTNQDFSMDDYRTGKLKGLYIPEERKALVKECGEDSVNLVFGPPTHLEKAEAMFLRMRELERDNWLSEEKKCEYLIRISYEISNACGKELDSNNPIWDKYATLYAEIPIEGYRSATSPLSYPELKKETMTVTADELNVAKTWLESSEAQNNLEKKLYLEYIIELVYISLKKIFPEVKKEIMGQ